jgi:hypothetical protein
MMPKLNTVDVKMMNKCSVVFVIGMVVATASYAFFGDWMQQGMAMPKQMMQLTQPQSPLICDCNCKN